MNQIFNPPTPEPQKKDTLTFNKKNVAIAFLALSLFILLIVIIVPGDNQSSPATTAAPVATYPPATQPPVVNKYDQYMDHVLNNSGQANTWSKAKLIEFGDLVCGALDSGNSIGSVVRLMEGYAQTSSDVEFFASVTYGAIVYLCPEYQSDLQAYLGN